MRLGSESPRGLYCGRVSFSGEHECAVWRQRTLLILILVCSSKLYPDDVEECKKGEIHFNLERRHKTLALTPSIRFILGMQPYKLLLHRDPVTLAMEEIWSVAITANYGCSCKTRKQIPVMSMDNNQRGGTPVCWLNKRVFVFLLLILGTFNIQGHILVKGQFFI